MLQSVSSTNKHEGLNRTPTVITSKGKRKPSHQVMQEMSEAMVKQNKALIRELRRMSKDMDVTSKSSNQIAVTGERIHDRLDTLIVEQRTTNILLAQLVSGHNSVMSDDPLDRIDRDKQAETIRFRAYDRVLRGE